MLHLQEFIKNHDNWEELLNKEPYCINIKRKDNRILFKYNILSSDFNNPIVQECRGLILEDVTFNVLCCPFYKFGNYGEGYVPEIDWNNCRVQEKIDGTLINMYYYNGKWCMSTTGCIDASDANLPTNLKYKNFYDLFMSACVINNLDLHNLSINNTYMFELVSPYNQVVIKYNNIDIYHLSTRNNITLQEQVDDIGIKHPQEYSLHSLNDCIKFVKTFKGHEGFVVVDNKWNRIKVKNPAYVAMQHTINNHTLTLERIIDIQESGDEDEFLNYFPEYVDDFWDITCLTDCVIADIQEPIDKLKTMCYNTRKEQAEYLLTTNFAQAGFMYLNGKCDDSISYWNSLTTAKKAKLLTMYEPKFLQK